MKPLIVVMGVSGSGKSTVGELLANRLDVPYLEGDSLHPSGNLEKMASGHPLTDEDRWPWLAAIGQSIADCGANGLIVACSALKRAYREAISRPASRTVFVHLKVPRSVLIERLGQRVGHFIPPALLDSQMATLEPLHTDESGVTIDAALPVNAVVESVLDWLSRSGAA